VHGAEGRAAVVAEVLAIDVAETNLIRISCVGLNVPIRRLIKSVMRVVVTVRLVFSSA